MSVERDRLRGDAEERHAWRRWGPYLSERQWGTVREDYSADGSAWEYFPHDHARSRAYRWGEDGLAGYSDQSQRICLGLGLWNGQDSIIKERLFGLSGQEGNHGEDVKECYYYLDASPSHSYLKMLYKYPQRAFPYEQLVIENRDRAKDLGEYELWDTGVFNDGRYFDIYVEYAKADPDDTLISITAHNRGPEPADLDILLQVWLRNTWHWKGLPRESNIALRDNSRVEIVHPQLGTYLLAGAEEGVWLFCENKTNTKRLFDLPDGQGPYKDGINDYIVHGDRAALSGQQSGSKAAVHHHVTIEPGGSVSLRARLAPELADDPFQDFDAVFAIRKQETDDFYAELQANLDCPELRHIQRTAWAGMIWSKQYYQFNVYRWLQGDEAHPKPPAQRLNGRNSQWLHLNNAEVISMPDKWEYPWYASWDLAFHCIPFALIDPEFAKKQLLTLGRAWYMHPNGQIPAYEWHFDDVNPPVQAWAAWRVFQIERSHDGDPVGDLDFLERIFHKLMLNFTWWVNRKDRNGNNIFEGGFLGLDNVGVFDRSKPLPGGAYIEQADGTSWMAMYCLNLMRIALELARHNRVYEDIATKFFEHFLYIAKAMNNMSPENIGLWDEQDEFYYDLMRPANQPPFLLKLRSIVGLIPLFAVETLEPELLDRLPDFHRRLQWVLDNRPDLARLVSRWNEPGRGERRLLSMLRGHRMKCLLRRMLDESEFLSPYGVRSMSKHHADHPYEFCCDDRKMKLTVEYESAESRSHLFGGNSNWRGPIWFPVNYLIIESLQKFHHYYGDDFKVECPTGSGRFLTINEIAFELGSRLIRLFQLTGDQQRPIYAETPAMQNDPNFRDHLLFHEYFDGDTGRGLGAAHQTGWTGLVAKLIQPRRACH